MARGSAVERAHRHLASLIDLRRVAPGDRLPAAADLAAEIGVSRPAVLQALRILSTEGRVVVRPGRGGTWVAGNDQDNLDARVARAWEQRQRIVDTAVLRTILEPGIARLAAERGFTPDEQAEADELHRKMLETRDHERYRALDTQFHQLVARATGVPLLVEEQQRAREGMAAALDLRPVPDTRVHTSNREHTQLLAAIRARDGAAAARVVRKHVDVTAQYIRAVFGDSIGPVSELDGFAARIEAASTDAHSEGSR